MKYLQNRQDSPVKSNILYIKPITCNCQDTLIIIVSD